MIDTRYKLSVTGIQCGIISHLQFEHCGLPSLVRVVFCALTVTACGPDGMGSVIELATSPVIVDLVSVVNVITCTR